MVATKPINRKRTQKRRAELRFDKGYTPPSWRCFMIAGVAVCHGIQALAQKSHQLNKGEDEHDGT